MARFGGPFLWPEKMDESELEQYYDMIDALDTRLMPVERAEDDSLLHEQLRDMRGFRVEGCYHVKPAPTE